MKPYKIFDFKKYKNISGELLPITFDKADQLKLKEFFLFMEKRKYKEVIMHTRSVHRFFCHYLVKLKLQFNLKK